MEPKTSRKIVSKGEYVKAKAKKMWLYYNALAALIFLPVFAYNPLLRLHLPSSWCTVLMIGIAILSASTFMKMAKSIFQEAKNLDTGVLLTRANTADLPTLDSLVRASSEPLQSQQGVLLRAAAEGQETPPEQLVRPAGGPNRVAEMD